MKQFLKVCLHRYFILLLLMSSFGIAQAQVPSEPTNLVATGINTGGMIQFTAPASDSGSAISNYEYSTDNGTNWTEPQAAAQKNNQTVNSDVPKQRGGDQGQGTGTWLGADRMYDIQADAEEDGPPDFNDNVTGALIDGGLSVVLAAGVFVGARHIRREVIKAKEENTSREND